MDLIVIYLGDASPFPKDQQQREKEVPCLVCDWFAICVTRCWPGVGWTWVVVLGGGHGKEEKAFNHWKATRTCSVKKGLKV